MPSWQLRPGPPPPAGWGVVRNAPGHGTPEWGAAWWVPEVLQLPMWGSWSVPAAAHPWAWLAALGLRSPALHLVAWGNFAVVLWRDGCPWARQ